MIAGARCAMGCTASVQHDHKCATKRPERSPPPTRCEARTADGAGVLGVAPGLVHRAPVVAISSTPAAEPGGAWAWAARALATPEHPPPPHARDGVSRCNVRGSHNISLQIRAPSALWVVGGFMPRWCLLPRAVGLLCRASHSLLRSALSPEFACMNGLTPKASARATA